MLSTSRWIPLRRPGSLAAALIFSAFLRWGGAGLDAQEPASVSAASGVLTSFDDIWHLPEAEQRQWHRVRLDYVVYYYDPLWQAMWGRCGESDSYLSLGNKVFPIKPGQRIRVEGLMQPAKGMRVEDPKVTVLADTAPIEVLSTVGDIGNSQRFNKHMVTIEGYVDRQVTRDSSHLEISLIAEGRPVLLQLLLKNDTPVPQLRDSLVRAKGVYFARTEDATAVPKIEVWVSRNEDIESLGSLDREERFNLPVTPLTKLASVLAGQPVHVSGVVLEQQAGQSITIGDQAMRVIVPTPQTLVMAAGDKVEAIGFVARENGVWVLRQGLFRPARDVLTSVRQIWELPENARQRWYRVRIDYVVYYFDPVWRALWGRGEGSNDYMSLAPNVFKLKAGQRILVEGSVFPANNVVIENPQITVLQDSVTLEPKSTRGQIGNTDRFNKELVTVEGYVDRQVMTDARHVELDLVVEGRAVVGRVLLPDGMTAPKWDGMLVRLQGVYSATQDPTGALPNLEIWTPGPESVEVLGSLEKDEQFSRETMSIEKLALAKVGELVRIAGVVRAQQPGKLLTIRDETGQVTLHTAQARSVQLGETVEAVGYVMQQGNERILRDALFRRSQTVAVAPAAGLPRLRLADQLRELQPEEAARSYPVLLTGVVTWAQPEADFFFIRDTSGGVCVYRPPDFNASLPVGATIEVNGVSASGKFTPVVLASSVTVAATVELPEPRPVTLEQALTGVEEAQWVSMSGYVRGMERDGPWTRLDLTTSAGEFQAMLRPDQQWAKLPGAVVRLRGVCSAVANSKRQLTGIQLWVPDSRFVEIEEAVPENPFAVTTRSIASLRQFGALETRNRRVRVSGVVVHQSPGRLVHIQDGTESLLVLSRDQRPLIPGDRIEAVGFPGRENSRVVLREAVYRRMASGAEPAPQRVKDLASIDAELDGRLVRLEGLLLDIGTHERGVRLISQHDQVIFEAVLDVPRSAVPESWIPGSHLALKGLYEIQFDEYRRPHAVRIQLRTLNDVEVLRQPSWWTVKRVLAVTGLLAVAAVLGFGWVIALRRRVHQQTGVIREQVENEKAARLEVALARASKLESLGVLAGGIAHDFNNLLTVVIGNLSLAKLDPKIEPDTVLCLTESERAAARARDLTQQLLTFAKGGEPMRTSTRLPDVVREAAQFALHGSKVRCEIDLAPDLWPADVDKGQIGQVVHNIVINASQAMLAGGIIQIGLRNDEIVQARGNLVPGRYVSMSFADAGSGISPENVTRIFEPYFTTKQHGSGLGLATVYSIVKRHQGHVEVTSKLGVGTTFNIWLPAATTAPAPVAAPVTVAPKKTGRVLFMDDEAPIRLLGTAVLKRQGYAVTAVSDGAAVVSEYAAATAAGRPFDLVILDLTVPGGMGGSEAMEKLRTMDPKVRAIVSSGYSSDPVMANYRAHGFRGRVPKPYEANDLVNTIKLVLSEV